MKGFSVLFLYCLVDESSTKLDENHLIYEIWFNQKEKVLHKNDFELLQLIVTRRKFNKIQFCAYRFLHREAASFFTVAISSFDAVFFQSRAAIGSFEFYPLWHFREINWFPIY